MKIQNRDRARACAFGLIAAVVVAASGAIGNPAGADTVDEGQTFLITAHALDGTGLVVANGPFHGVGEYRLMSHRDDPDGTSTDLDEFELPDGMVFFSDTYTTRIRLEGESCTWLIAVDGTYTVTGGTDAYAGVSGGGTFTASGRFVTARDDTGDCFGLDSPPLSFSEEVHGSGTTTLP